ncbi:peptidoglycan D,D-transpeptidase FtsI family protein [Diplocloster hominis]|uniref:peptidoglycan D,D-transpeptidase FtsI family protein n=1 Tax=Diplocloster hominis TaxID=3079010 RepID=UPI0031BB1A9D
MFKFKNKKSEKEQEILNLDLQDGENGTISPKKRDGKKKNRELLLVAYLFVGMFTLLMAYFVYFNTTQADDVINNPYNSRQDTFADRYIRGKILANDGEVLAETALSGDGTETRRYPYKDLFAHVVGYSTVGKTGIESLGNFSLLSSHAFFLEQLENEFKGEKNIGDNVVTTLDVELQKTAYDAMGKYDGAVVALEPSTGKVLAMVSKPTYDPNKIQEQWDTLTAEDNESTALLNRATQGLYPPGSTFKIITTLEYVRENGNYEQYSYDCHGEFTADDVTINCYKHKSHGVQNLMESFAHSCNSSYANIGMDLNMRSFNSLCDSLLFNKELPVSLPYSKSKFIAPAQDDTAQKLMTAIGQGEGTLVSPMHMALITSAIANNGVLMKPYFIDRIENYTGDKVKQYKPAEYGALLSEGEAALLKSYMIDVVEEGTATKLSGQNYTAAGKTGSAEYSSNKAKSHAWFVGFSNVESPDLVVAVILEGAGAGSDYAVPVAKKLFAAYAGR